MAQRISRQITAQTNRLKQSVIKYNNLPVNIDSKLPAKIMLNEAYNVEAALWNHLQEKEHLVGNGFVPAYVKRTLIDLSHRVSRCHEEVDLIKSEMKNTLHFYEAKVKILGDAIHQQPNDCTYDIGVRGLLLRNKQAIEKKLAYLQDLFHKCADVVGSTNLLPSGI